jgi:hypothetical protein
MGALPGVAMKPPVLGELLLAYVPEGWLSSDAGNLTAIFGTQIPGSDGGWATEIRNCQCNKKGDPKVAFC